MKTIDDNEPSYRPYIATLAGRWMKCLVWAVDDDAAVAEMKRLAGDEKPKPLDDDMLNVSRLVTRDHRRAVTEDYLGGHTMRFVRVFIGPVGKDTS